MPYSSPYETGGYTPPSAAATGSGMKEQAMSGSDWIQAAQLFKQWYDDRNPAKPKFTETPLSPEQKQLHELYLKSLMNPETSGNANALNQIAKQQLSGLSGMKWTSPKTFSGDTGYSGSSTSFTPPWAPNMTPSSSTPTSAPPRSDGLWNIQSIPNRDKDELFGLQQQVNLNRREHPGPPTYFDDTGADQNVPGPGTDRYTNRFLPTSLLEDNGALPVWGEPDPLPYGIHDDRLPNGGGVVNLPGTAAYFGTALPSEVTQFAGKSADPNGGVDHTGFWGWITHKIGSAVPHDQEGRERWAARGLSLVAGSLGFPIPPSVLDKGWDGLQWIYHKIANPHPNVEGEP